MPEVVTVVMPAYNASRYIKEAIESVLIQTYKDFELIVIDDGSTDTTPDIIDDLAKKDSRIHLITQSNQGVANALNGAIELATTRWIVVMHADDIMMPNRIERQLEFVYSNPDIVVAGSFILYINERGRIVGKFKSPLTTREIVWEYVQKNELIGLTHPSVIMRKDVVEEVGGYRNQFVPAEDIDLWNRIVEKGYGILVQPKYLLKYRLHSSAASVSKAMLIRLHLAWLKECMLRRRQGQPEPIWEEFLEIYRRRHSSERFRQGNSCLDAFGCADLSDLPEQV